MTTRINLLGPPSIDVDGERMPRPRGSKSWALLAYLVLAGGPVPRARLAGLLFEEARDPGAALRWTLSQVRKALGDSARVDGDPVRFVAVPGTVVDTDVLTSGSWAQALSLPGLDGQLLEGVSPRVGPAFDVWLSTERRRLGGTARAMLHEAAHSKLARGDAPSAVAIASRLVGADPLDESGHVLLVRALVAAGDRSAAAGRAARCRDLFRRELGNEPSTALSDALRVPPVASLTRGRPTVLAELDAGLAASRAGAYDHAVGLLRSASTAARAHGDDELTCRAVAALGTVLVQGVRGADEEGVSALHEASVRARRCGARDVAVQAAIEIGHVETLRGHYCRMEAWLDEAATLAEGEPRHLAWINLYAGLGRTDVADYARATESLVLAEDFARVARDERAVAYALAGLGRLRLLRRELGPARAALDAAFETAGQVGWTAFLPWPGSLRAEVDLHDGKLEDAAAGFEHSYALACQVGDPCWESYSLRGRGLLAADRQDHGLALDLLAQAPRACRRLPDTHRWVEAYCLDALCGYAIGRELGEAPVWIDQLDDLASVRGMREMIARAALHRARLGQPGASEAAALLLDRIDNPALR